MLCQLKTHFIVAHFAKNGASYKIAANCIKTNLQRPTLSVVESSDQSWPIVDRVWAKLGMLQVWRVELFPLVQARDLWSHQTMQAGKSQYHFFAVVTFLDPITTLATREHWKCNTKFYSPFFPYFAYNMVSCAPTPGPNGDAENAGMENGGPWKVRGWKMRDWKTRDQIFTGRKGHLWNTKRISIDVQHLLKHCQI